MKDLSTFKLSNMAIAFIIIAFAVLISIPIVGLNKMKTEDDMAKISAEQDELMNSTEKPNFRNLKNLINLNSEEIKDLISRVGAIENYLHQNGGDDNQNRFNGENSYTCEVTGYADLNNNPIIPPEIGNDGDFSGDVANGSKKIILTCGISR